MAVNLTFSSSLKIGVGLSVDTLHLYSGDADASHHITVCVLQRRAYAVVTTTIRLRFDCHSTAVRLRNDH